MNNENNLIGNNVQMYGPVQLGSNVIIEDGAVIGHPSPEEIDTLHNLISKYDSLKDFYNKCTKNLTIIGNNCIIRSGSVIYSGCNIGNDFDCGHNVIIRENVSVGNNVYIKPFTYIMTYVQIGSCCRIAGTIADYTVIGNNVSSFGILTHRRIRKYSEFQDNLVKKPKDTHGPVIDDNCVIGRNAIVVGNIHIAINSSIGANAFVNFNVPPNGKILGIKGKNYSSDD